MVSPKNCFPEKHHVADLCVVGGGIPGVCAALAAARHGLKVIIMQDRPVLGGNSSSECRVHICGADRAGGIPHRRETGILEELRLENIRRNRQKSFSIWDTVLYEAAMQEPNLDVLYNCSCHDAEMDGARILAVAGWQLTTQTRHVVKADIFADCSGDAVLAPLTGARFRIGREARSEFNESFAPERADRKTMGMTCWFQAYECDTPQPFSPPEWAYTFEHCDQLPGGHQWPVMGYWWVEMGGEHDSIHQTEEMRDELLKIIYGVWDHLKNHCEHRDQFKNWVIDWINFLPAKRESRRYVGDHVLAQPDIEGGGAFDDVVAYGGWTMDDHHPAGFWCVKAGAPPTEFHHAPSPFGIPYRSLYSKNIDNLMFAGRCHSATHFGLSSTRVMATGAVMGQAVGTAASIARREAVGPRDVNEFMDELQQTLLRDDCYLPGIARRYSDLTRTSELSASQGDPEPLRDGITRQVEDDPHSWEHAAGDWAMLAFAEPQHVKEVQLVLDSALDRDIQMHLTRKDPEGWWDFPDVMPRVFTVEARQEGEWKKVAEFTDNHQRLIRVPVNDAFDAVRYTLHETWGAGKTRLYAFSVS